MIRITVEAFDSEGKLIKRTSTEEGIVLQPYDPPNSSALQSAYQEKVNQTGSHWWKGFIKQYAATHYSEDITKFLGSRLICYS